MKILGMENRVYNVNFHLFFKRFGQIFLKFLSKFINLKKAYIFIHFLKSYFWINSFFFLKHDEEGMAAKKAMIYENNNVRVNMNGVDKNQITLTWEHIDVIGPDPNNCLTRCMKKPIKPRKDIIKDG